MGLLSLLCNTLVAFRSLDPSPILYGEGVFGYDFGLSSSKIPANISQIGQDKVLLLLTTSVSGH